MTDRFAPLPGSWSDVMGVRFVRVSREAVVAELTIAAQHKQAGGLVHGGVYAGLVETAASLGATLSAEPGAQLLGIENHSSFLHAAREGLLRATATPIHVGRSTQLWTASVLHIDADGEHLAASGLVRLLARASEKK